MVQARLRAQYLTNRIFSGARIAGQTMTCVCHVENHFLLTSISYLTAYFMLLGEYNTTVLPTYHQHAGIEGTNKNYRLKERQMATSFLNGWLQRALMNLPLLHTTVCVCVRVVLLPYIVLYRIPFQNIRGLFEKKNCTNNGTAAGRTSLVSPKRMNARNFF